MEIRVHYKALHKKTNTLWTIRGVGGARVVLTKDYSDIPLENSTQIIHIKEFYKVFKYNKLIQTLYGN